MKKEMTPVQLLLPMIVSAIAFGIWQHSLFAGVFILFTLTHHSNHSAIDR